MSFQAYHILRLIFLGLCIFTSKVAFSSEQKTEPHIRLKNLVILGDSLTEGYGVSKEDAFPSLMEKRIQSEGKNWKITNAGVGGSTTASGPGRLKWLLKSKPDMIIIALGANDGLRGISVKTVKANIESCIEMAKKSGAKVVLAGILLPPNYGKEYIKQFEAIFPDLAKRHQIRLIPFLLDKVAGVAELNQTDAIHPNSKGHQVIAETVYKNIRDLL